jgi:hypothetical protein
MGPSLLELERRAQPRAGDVALIESIAERIVEELGVEPPIDERLVASYQGISSIEVVEIPWSGMLFTDSQAMRIQIAAGDGRRRQRFTCFHETGHTFLPGFRLAVQYRCLAGGSRDPVEALSDAAASALLLPRRRLLADLSVVSVSSRAVEWLASRYDASLEATMRRIVDLSETPAVMVVLEKRHKLREPAGTEPKLRVRYSHPFGPWPFIPRNKSVSRDGAITEALARGRADGRVEDLDGLVPGVSSKVSALDASFVDRDGEFHERVLAFFTEDGIATGDGFR